MSTSALRAGVLDLLGELEELATADRRGRQEWAMVIADAEQPGYLIAIRALDWNGLATRARKELRARRNDLREMAKRQARIAGLLRKLQAFSGLGQAFEIPFVERSDWPDTRTRLTEELVRRDLDAEAIRAAIARLEATASRKVEAFETLKTAAARSAARLDDLATTHLTARLGATLALAVARFNQLVTDKARQVANPIVFCEETERKLDTAERCLWKALGKGDLASVWAAAADIRFVAASALLDGAIPHAASLALSRKEKGADPAVSVRLGNLIRDLLTGIALGHYVGWVSNWPEGLGPTKLWLQSARKLPYSSKRKAPGAVSLQALASKPQGYDGRQLTVEGLLGKVDIVHRGRKAISSAPVVDEKTGASIRIAIPYIKLDSGGMAEGALVRVSGTWKTRSSETEEPALIIDRLNFGLLGKSSWRDWATAQLASIFEDVPHGLAASWSWEPGVDGAGNQLRYDTWFSRRGGRD